MNFIEEIGKNPKYLIIFLHGYTGDKYDMFELKNYLHLKNKSEYHFISVDGVDECETGTGRQWFSLKDYNFPLSEKDEYRVKDDINSQYKSVNNFIDEQVKKHNYKYENVFLIGFSQGGAISLYSSFRFDKKLGGIISLSGFCIENEETIKKETVTKQKVLFLYGDKDQVVEKRYFEKSIKIMMENDFDLKFIKFKNLAHRVGANEVLEVEKFINQITHPTKINLTNYLVIFPTIFVVIFGLIFLKKKFYNKTKF